MRNKIKEEKYVDELTQKYLDFLIVEKGLSNNSVASFLPGLSTLLKRGCQPNQEHGI